MEIGELLHIYRVPIILAGISLFLIVVSVTLLIQATRTATPIEFSSEATASANLGKLTVDVEGEVTVPGIYTLPIGSRVDDVLTAAGGLTSDADTAYVSRVLNRAGKLTDGAKIFIPRETERESMTASDQLIPDPAGESAGVSVMSVNTASQAELESLPGIGPVTAQKIISNRPYLTLEELVPRKVLGPSLYEDLKDSLSL